jgi:hypothetical protein
MRTKTQWLIAAVLLLWISVLSVSDVPADAACVNPPAGLVSWWGGDNNALDIVGTNNGTIHGGITYSQGEVGRAFNFDGANGSYLQIPSGTALNIQGSLSISAWVYSRNVSGIRLIAGKAGGTQLYSVDGILHFVVYSGGPHHAVSTTALAGNSWHHVAGVFNGSAGTLMIYIDGVLNNTLPSIPSQLDTNVTPYEIGGFSAYADNLDGLIDEVAIFNQALTGTDVQNIYNAGGAGMCRPSVAPPSGLISWWKGENNANDQLGINNGTLMNGATFAQGKVGQAFSLDGSDDYVQVSDSPSLNIGVGDFSLHLWVNYAVVKTGDYVLLPNVFISQDEGGYSTHKWVFFSSDNGLYFHINNAGSYTFVGPVAFTPQAGQWYQLTVTRSGTLYSFYVNGALAGTVTDSMSIPDVSAPMTIGQAEGHGFFNGLIDEAAIFNRALAADEVASIYNSGSSGMNGLISWWKADGNADDSVGAHSGTAAGGVAYIAGKIGQAFSLDGSDDSVEVGNWFNLQSFTISMWVNPAASQQQYANIIDNNHSSNPARSWVMQQNDSISNQYSFYGYSSTVGDVSAFPGVSFTLQANQWTHVVVTRDGSTRIGTVFINGIALPSVTGTTDINYDGSQNLHFGRHDNLGRNWAGKLDEIQIYSRALSVAEVSKLAGTYPDTFNFTAQTGMPLSTTIASNPITITGINSAAAISIAGGEYQINGGSWTSLGGTVNNGDTVIVHQISSGSYSTMTTSILTIGGVSGAFNVTTAASGDPNASGLVSWWRAENNAYDSVGNNNGILRGGMSFVPGVVGQAFSLDGVNDYLEIPHSDSLNFGAHQPMSIILWVKRTSTSGISTIFAKRGDCGYQVHYLLQWYGPGNWLVFGSTGAPGNGLTTTADKLPLNTWTNISVTFDGTTATMYINGFPVASNAMYFDPNTAPLTLGAEPVCGDFFGGLIDEVKIFNRGLSTTEVGTLSGQLPNSFSFTPVTSAPISSLVESNAITINGISYPTAIAITACTSTNCEYQINGGSWTNSPSTVNPGATVKVHQTSSASYFTTTMATLTIGGVNGNFDVTTKESRTLAIAKDGTGGGTVTTNPAGIDCGSTCSASFGLDDSVDISASADSDSGFRGFAGGCSTNATVSHCTVTVSSGMTVNATFDLKSDFSGDPVTGAAPLAVQFKDLSITGATSWQWNFGDGGTSTLQNPLHIYKTPVSYPTSYSISLTANGETTTRNDYITLMDGCANGPVMIGAAPYQTIQGAFETTLYANDVIRVLAVDRTEPLTHHQGVAVKLQGGFDCAFRTNTTEFTTVHGTLTISGGTVTIENMIVR